MIKSLSLRNFMSYVSADIPLSQGVNFICGPNGAGKSTLLIAISLALGLSHTERGKRLSDLIRWGAERSSIRLVLDNRTENGSRPFPDFEMDELEIERTLTRAGSYPIKIDGVPSTKEELTALIGRQGINPNNMLIIMQQDMVEEFSLLSPADKLSMLEEVIEFQTYRKDLLQASDDLEALLEEEKQTRRILDGSNRRVTEWERLYEKYQRKRKLEDQLEELSAEALWAKVSESEKTVQLLESRKGERAQELDHITKRMRDLEKRTEERSGLVEGAWSALESSRRSLMDAQAEHAVLGAKVSMVGDRIEQEKADAEVLRASADKDRAEIELVLSRLREIDGGIGDEESSLEEEMTEAKSRLREVLEAQSIAGREDELAAKLAQARDLERRISTTRERLEYPFGKDLLRAAEELKHLADISGEVYGPVYSCLESDDLSMDVLRTLLGEGLLKAFVVTRESDREKVSTFLKKRSLDSKVYYVPESALVIIEQRFLPDDDGVLDWAVNRINAPRHVKAVLQNAAGDVLLVRSGMSVEEMARSLNTQVMNVEGERAGLLRNIIPEIGGKVSEEGLDLERELRSLTARYSKVSEEAEQLAEQVENLRAARLSELNSVLEYLLSVSSRLELIRSGKVSAESVLQKEADRVRARSGALADFKEKRLEEKSRLIKGLERDLGAYEKSAAGSAARTSKAELAYQRSREKLERQLKAYYELETKKLVLVEQIRSARNLIRDLEYRISRQREEVGGLIQRAEELSPRITTPRDLLELEKEISTIRGSLMELDDVPDDIEGVYRVYLSEFENLKHSLESVIERREEMQSELRKGLDRWREIMNEHLQGINSDFNEILAEIGGRGRVELVGEQVRRVGLDIMIGFEGKEMTSISTLTQSGGEKSLSTMAFLLALQRQIKSPFRAVDEYDVHLDPMNRDRVTQLLKSAVRKDSKQYVAITPSQISRHDLEEAENVVVVQSVGGRSRVGSLVVEASS